jgi:hypothetical protein
MLFVLGCSELSHCIDTLHLLCTLLLQQRDPAASAKLHAGVSSVKAALAAAAAAAAAQLRQPGATTAAAAGTAKPSGLVCISVSTGTPFHGAGQQQQRRQLHKQALQNTDKSPDVTASVFYSTAAGTSNCISV